LIEAKQNNEGKTPYGYASELIKDVKNSIQKLNLNLVNYYVAKQTASMAVNSSDNSTATQTSLDSSTPTLVLTHSQAKNSNNDAGASLAMDISDDSDSEEEFVPGLYYHTDDESDSDQDRLVMTDWRGCRNRPPVTIECTGIPKHCIIRP